MKDIKDYLHLYLGCRIVSSNYIELQLSSDNLQRAINENWKPILRRLWRMTNEEFSYLYFLSEGVYDYERQDVKRLATNEIYLRFGKHSEKIFGYFKLLDGDVRVNQGISFYVRTFIIQESLFVNEAGIDTSESHFNKEQAVIAGNQSELFFHLLSKHFDLFNLIDEGLAIDSIKFNSEPAVKESDAGER
jgi:hypothetical protein